MEEIFIDKGLIESLFSMLNSNDAESKELFWGIYDNILESTDEPKLWEQMKKYADDELILGNDIPHFTFYNLILSHEWDKSSDKATMLANGWKFHDEIKDEL